MSAPMPAEVAPRSAPDAAGTSATETIAAAEAYQRWIESKLSPGLDLRVVLPGAVAVLAAAVLAFWGLGLFDSDDGTSDRKVITAVIGLVGIFLTEVLGIATALIKHSIDLRTYWIGVLEQARLTAEADASRAQQEASERRLTVETMVKAAELMGADPGAAGRPERTASAIGALVRLGERDFALALLEETWRTGTLSMDSASNILEPILLDGTDKQVEYAVGILAAYAPKDLASTEVTSIPYPIGDGWPTDPRYTADAKAYLVMLVAKTFQCLSERTEQPPRPVRQSLLRLLLGYCWSALHDDAVVVHGPAAIVLTAALPLMGPDDTLVLGAARVERAEVLDRVAAVDVSAVRGSLRHDMAAVARWADASAAAAAAASGTTGSSPPGPASGGEPPPRTDPPAGPGVVGSP